MDVREGEVIAVAVAVAVAAAVVVVAVAVLAVLVIGGDAPDVLCAKCVTPRSATRTPHLNNFVLSLCGEVK